MCEAFLMLIITNFLFNLNADMWETNELNKKENNRMDSRFSQIEDISMIISDSEFASCDSAGYIPYYVFYADVFFY